MEWKPTPDWFRCKIMWKTGGKPSLILVTFQFQWFRCKLINHSDEILPRNVGATSGEIHIGVLGFYNFAPLWKGWQICRRSSVCTVILGRCTGCNDLIECPRGVIEITLGVQTLLTVSHLCPNFVCMTFPGRSLVCRANISRCRCGKNFHPHF